MQSSQGKQKFKAGRLKQRSAEGGIGESNTYLSQRAEVHGKEQDSQRLRCVGWGPEGTRWTEPALSQL